MLIVDLAKWENNEYYVIAEYKEDSYYYSFTCDNNYEITHYLILPMDYDEDDEAIFTDEYLGIADYLLYDVGAELENILRFDILKK